MTVAALPVLSGCVVATSSGRSGGGGGALLGFLLLPFLFFLFTGMLARRARRTVSSGVGRAVPRTHEPAGAPNLTMLRAELSVIADDVLRLEPQVALNEQARDDYEAALHRYRVATAALESDEDVDPWRLQRVVDEATWSMSRVRAALAGRPLPPPPEPLARPGVRGEPAVTVDAGERPVYRGAPMSYRSGWFGGGGGLFGGLLLGSMLGGMGGWWMSDGFDGGDEPGDPMGPSGDDGFDAGDW